MEDFLKKLSSVIKKLLIVSASRRENVPDLVKSAQRKKRFIALTLITLAIISFDLWLNHAKYFNQFMELKVGFTEGARTMKNQQALKSDINYGVETATHPTEVDVEDFRLPEVQRDSDKFEQKLKNFTESNKDVVDKRLLDTVASM